MKVLSYTHIGKKEKNQDFLKHNKNCLLVCDGVGGAAKGEKASKEIANHIVNNYTKPDSNELKIEQIINNAQVHLNSLVQEEPLLEGMATTLAAVFFGKKGIFTAHAGDSRIYLVKPRLQCFWQTWDHSLVGNLIKKNEITREEGRKHPLNHQIFKAFKGNLEGRITSSELNFLSDLEQGDICFICSDGISETFSDLELLELLSNSSQTLTDKLECIKQRCIVGSKDNHSAIICEFEGSETSNFSGYPTDWKNISSLIGK